MRYLGYEKEVIEDLGGLHTAREIAGQPSLWQEIFELVYQQRSGIGAFLTKALAAPQTRIILTGAGSSAFIGEAAAGIVQASTGHITQALANTDLITHPQLHFMREVPTLMVSFARSGNSPESVAAVELANAHCDQVHHLIITCNKEGALVQGKFQRTYYLVLPEQANDKSLAMTGSFTGMLLSVLLVMKISSIDALRAALAVLVQDCSELLVEHLPFIKAVAEQPYQRVIFLGSGPLLGIARECHLKLQELTDGRIVCKHDSFLGFRHGPRAVINEETLVVYLFSNNSFVFQYERDLALSVDADTRGVPTMSFGRRLQELEHSVLDITLSSAGNEAAGPETELSFIGATLLGQLLGFYHCLYLGLHPDNPSVSGAIARVVQGVIIYSGEGGV